LRVGFGGGFGAAGWCGCEGVQGGGEEGPRGSRRRAEGKLGAEKKLGAKAYQYARSLLLGRRFAEANWYVMVTFSPIRGGDSLRGVAGRWRGGAAAPLGVHGSGEDLGQRRGPRAAART